MTVPEEGVIWKLAVETLGKEALQTLVAQLLQSHVSTRKVDNVGFLRLEWLGAEALEALREGQRITGKRSMMLEEDPTKVALPSRHRSHLLRGIIQAIPSQRLREDLLEWRLQLDLGM